MRSIIHPVVVVLDRFQRRFARSRPGSVLILTVVMVVLLALLGTALLSTTRIDRYTSAQNTVNNQIDLLVEGVKEMAKAEIRAGLYGPGPAGGGLQFKPPIDTSAAIVAGAYGNYDMPKLDAGTTNLSQAWLSPRAPAAGGDSDTNPVIYWPAIGQWLTGSEFESPFVTEPPPPGGNPPKVRTDWSPVFTDRLNANGNPLARFRPTFVQPRGYAEMFPAFAFAPSNGGLFRFFIAADADGDGIADAGFFKLPVGQIDGVTYYAAVRIVDNNSLINLNTAFSRGTDFSEDGSPRDATGTAAADFVTDLGWFRSHIGLEELLPRSPAGSDQLVPQTYSTWNAPGQYARSEMTALNRFRMGYLTGSDNQNSFGNYTASATPMMDPLIAPNTTSTTPEARSDGTFGTQGEALELQFSRRLRNPGYNAFSTGTGSASFRAFSISDAVSLAYRNGVMLNLDASPSTVESIFYNAVNRQVQNPMRDSIYSSAPNYNGTGAVPVPLVAGQRAYKPSQVAWWFDQNYNADGEAKGTINMIPAVPPGQENLFPLTPIAYRSLRPFVTTWNLTSMTIQERNAGAITPPTVPLGMTQYPTNNSAPKTSVNTAKFEELWRAFWCVMKEQPGNVGSNTFGAGTPFRSDKDPNAPVRQQDLYLGMHFTPDPAGPSVFTADDSMPKHPQRMFRNSIRHPNVSATDSEHIKPENMVVLRAAIAATQTEALRQHGTAATLAPSLKYFNRIPIQVEHLENCEATIFFHEPQPFITEIYVSTSQRSLQPAPPGGAVNERGYWAIELYNPYPDDISLDGYEIITVQKDIGRTYPLPAVPPHPAATEPAIYTFSSADTIQAGGYLVLENLNATPLGAVYRPTSTKAPRTAPPSSPSNRTRWIEGVPLHRAYNRELVIRKKVVVSPIRAGDYRPIDSFDFTLVVNGDPNGTSNLYHYARPSGDSGASLGNRWKCVYPGRYWANEADYRQQGFDYAGFNWNDPQYQTQEDPWETEIVHQGTPGPNGMPKHAQVTLGEDNPTASWDPEGKTSVFTIQLFGPDTPGPNKLNGLGSNKFPQGGFAREGDMLQIPFIGAYVIERLPPPNTTGEPELVEMNSISMDAAFAEDTDINDDEQPVGATTCRESIGRFAPIWEPDAALNRNDLNPGTYDMADNSTANKWNYRWATRLFDYLTVRGSQEDFLPHVTVERAALAGVSQSPQAVDNDGDDKANDQLTAPINTREDLDGVQGLININTAPWRVWSDPLLKTGDHLTIDAGSGSIATVTPGSNGKEDMVELAKAIVTWRDGDPVAGIIPGGPFTNLFDLYRVPAFRAVQSHMLSTVADPVHGPTRTLGDFAPLLGGDDYTRYDFEENYLLLNRISNLITTRSDSFTVYVLVQGWRGIGTAKPELVTQRRAAFIQDRHTVNRGDGHLPAAVNVPND